MYVRETVTIALIHFSVDIESAEFLFW